MVAPPMTPQRYERLQQLFVATCDLTPAQKRAEVTRRLCPDDPALRELADRLVRADARLRAGRGP